MTTKTDTTWAAETAESVLAMGREIKRLEGILDRIETFLDPNRSPGVCTEAMVKHVFNNMSEEIEALKLQINK